MIRAELLKLSSTTAAKVAVIVGVVGLVATQVTLVTVLPAVASGAIGPGVEALGVSLPEFDLATAAAQLNAVNPLGSSTGSGSIGIAVLSVLLLGVLGGTTDYRFGGIVTAALARPRRGAILLSKVGAMALAGLATGIAYALVSLATLLVALQITGAELVVGWPELLGVLSRGAAVVALLALLGLAVGILVRNQLAGVLTMFGILLFELIFQSMVQLIAGTLPVWAQILPLALGQAAVSSGAGWAIPPVAALAVLAGLVAAVTLAAGALMRTRDI
jgi:ABC-2 type transport system permease protein